MQRILLLTLGWLAIVLGTTWSPRDLLGYAAGIAAMALLDYMVNFQ